MLFAILLMLFAGSVFSQKKLDKDVQAIVDEGKMLYKSEMASWHGTDIVMEQYPDKEKLGGYFSYIDQDTIKCIFYSRAENPKVLSTIKFDTTFNLETVKSDFTERNFTANEKDLHDIRKIAFEALVSNPDGFFKFYDNTNPNIIPFINEKEKKVYILTGPQKSGIIIFGNDYLLTFDKSNKIKSKKPLHQNIIPIDFENVDADGEIGMTMHSHLPETGDYITATDICTLMLYSKFAQWKTHNVVSKNYLNIWSCEANELSLIPMSTLNKINKDQEKRNKKKEK